MKLKKWGKPVADAHAALAAATLIRAAQDARAGSLEAASWLASPDGGLFYAEALKFDLPLERWARRQEAKIINRQPGRKQPEKGG